MSQMETLRKQCDELEDRNRDLAGAIQVLAGAIRDIEALATDSSLEEVDAWSRVLHICQAGGVRTAMSVTGT